MLDTGLFQVLRDCRAYEHDRNYDNIRSMGEQDEADGNRFVFLLDASIVGTLSAYERKSAINSHAARRMHLKRRQVQRKQLQQNEEPHEASQALEKLGYSGRDVDQSGGLDSLPTQLNNEPPGMELWDIRSHDGSTVPHLPMSKVQGHCSTHSMAVKPELDPSRGPTSSTGSSPSMQGSGLAIKVTQDDNDVALSMCEVPDIPPLRDSGVGFRTNSSDRENDCSRYGHLSLSDSFFDLPKPGNPTATYGYAPLCRLGSGHQDPFFAYPIICSRDDHKLLHFCEIFSTI